MLIVGVVARALCVGQGWAVGRRGDPHFACAASIKRTRPRALLLCFKRSLLASHTLNTRSTTQASELPGPRQDAGVAGQIRGAAFEGGF